MQVGTREQETFCSLLNQETVDLVLTRLRGFRTRRSKKTFKSLHNMLERFLRMNIDGENNGDEDDEMI